MALFAVLSLEFAQPADAVADHQAAMAAVVELESFHESAVLHAALSLEFARQATAGHVAALLHHVDVQHLLLAVAADATQVAVQAEQGFSLAEETCR